MISGMWRCGLLCFSSRLVGIIVGCRVVVVLSFCSLSCVAFIRACKVGFVCGVVISNRVCVLKSLAVLFSRCMLTIGHLPSLCFSSR